METSRKPPQRRGAQVRPPWPPHSPPRASRGGTPLTWASVLGRGAPCRLLQVPGDSLHRGPGPQRGGVRGAVLPPHGGSPQGAGHAGFGRVRLEQGCLLGRLRPGRGLHSIFPVHQRHLPPDDGHGQAAVLRPAGRGPGGPGRHNALWGGVRALRGGRGAHVIELHEDAVTREAVEHVPGLDRVPVVQVLGCTGGRHRGGQCGRRGVLVSLRPFWGGLGPRQGQQSGWEPPFGPRLLLGWGRWRGPLHRPLLLWGAGPRPLLAGTRPPVLPGPALCTWGPG